MNFPGYEQFDILKAFEKRPGQFGKLREQAETISILLGQVSPLIRRYTEEVCPDCCNVCCIERHSRFAYDDLIYLFALGEEPAPRKEGFPDSKPCQFLGPRGCVISHSRRPYRCTWYFCAPLLERIETNSVRGYREFVALLAKITQHREALLNGFAETLKSAARHAAGNRRATT